MHNRFTIRTITYILFILLLFFLSTNLALFFYRTLPLPSFFTPLEAPLTQDAFFVNSLVRTPIARNRNFFKIPLAIGVAVIRRFIPLLDNFIRNRRPSNPTFNLDDPQIADMVIPPFDLPDTDPSRSRNNYVQTRQAIGNLLSLTLFFILFLFSLLIVTKLIYSSIKLLGNITRNVITTTNEVKQLTSKSNKNNKMNNSNNWLE